MKKLVNFAFSYAVIALIAGVFYREFTKIMSFTGVTTLSVVHTHLLALGMLFLLVVLALEVSFKLTEQKLYPLFFNLYNGGLVLTVIMFITRGIFQVLGTDLSKGLTASISGIAGIGHALTGAGLVIFFLVLKKAVAAK